MLSSCKILRASVNLSNSNFNKGLQKCRLHIYASPNLTPGKRRLILRKETPIHLGAISSLKFISYDSAIPDPPPPIPPSDIEVLKALGILKDVEEVQIKVDTTPPHNDEVLHETLETIEVPTGDPGRSFVPTRETEDFAKSFEFSEVLPFSSEEIEVLPDLTSKVHEALPESLSPDQTPQEFPSYTEVLSDPPLIPEVLPDPPQIPEASVAPTLESLGLGGWTPVGLVQRSLDYLHIGCDIPWWGAILIGTAVVRLLMFPLVIISQRNSAKMHNNLPGMQRIQLKMTDARERGDRVDAARYSQELMGYMQEKGLNPLKNMLVPLAQAPLFLSFFMGLRGMANLPVESMREGGLYWFVDLTVPDQYYLLPIITSATLALTIEMGTDTARLNAANLGLMKYVIKSLPLVIFPFTVSFPSGILVYWASTNFISLLQVSILKIPRVREYFKIPKLETHDKTKLPIKDKGFVKGVKDSWTNMKITRELQERERIDEMNFSRAGRGAVVKTYKYDPTQKVSTPNLSSLQAKKRT